MYSVPRDTADACLADPAVQSTRGVQCEHHRRSDDTVPTSQWLTEPETPSPDCAVIDHPILRLTAHPFSSCVYLTCDERAGMGGNLPPE